MPNTVPETHSIISLNLVGAIPIASKVSDIEVRCGYHGLIEIFCRAEPGQEFEDALNSLATKMLWPLTVNKHQDSSESWRSNTDPNFELTAIGANPHLIAMDLIVYLESKGLSVFYSKRPIVFN
jgi:hypothetical protein